MVERVFCDVCEAVVGGAEIPDWFTIAVIPMSADSKKPIGERTEGDLCPRCFAGIKVEEAYQVVLQITRKGGGGNAG